MNRHPAVLIAGILIALATPSLLAQTTTQADRFHSELSFQFLHFGNFFQLTDPAQEEDVNAGQAELRLAMRFSPADPTEGYLQAGFIEFDGEGLDSSTRGRIGVRRAGAVNDFDVYSDLQRDRPTFDVGNEFARADVDSVHAEYARRLTRAWQVGIEGDHQEQSFDLAPQKDNRFRSAGASVRYRGFGSVFSPEIGVHLGNRDVEDDEEDYDQEEIYLQVRSVPTPRLYLSLRYRDRTRDYEINDPDSRNFGRTEDRSQWALTAEFQSSRRVSWTFYGTWEDVDSSRPGRDFDHSLALLSLNITLW